MMDEFRKEIEIARRREVQMIGAAISTRSWHDVEVAYNQLRDRIDRALMFKPEHIPAPSKNKHSSCTEDAPELDANWFAEADAYDGDRLVRRGRPKTDNPKQMITLRLDPDVLERYRAIGPGWQTKMNHILKTARLEPDSIVELRDANEKQKAQMDLLKEMCANNTLAHLLDGPWHQLGQPQAVSYAGVCKCGRNFFGASVTEVRKAWSIHVAEKAMNTKSESSKPICSADGCHRTESCGPNCRDRGNL